ncbi:MAG TPA: effector-associated domain EAD1-containing protein [Kofleriaceae bacterium]|nr:effector-associated domain EAD1-containing protein [Kofleriaceae bacterium]
MAGEQYQALQNSLLQAFPSDAALRELLRLGMDLRLAHITTARSLPVMVLDVIEDLESRGRLEELLGRACELKPYNQDLRGVVERYWPGALRPTDLPPPPAPPRETITDADWDDLIASIDKKKCTPVIGPSACQDERLDSTTIAAEWAVKWKYPFPDQGDFTRVSQFLALTRHRLWPHDEIQQRYKAASPPDFQDPEEPHALLADLKLPLYLTTRYDDFMLQALAHRGITATRAFPRWKEKLRDQAFPPAVPAEGPPAVPAEGPLVYHLFGHHELLTSMVLTEDDCFNFFASVVADERLFPPVVTTALGGTSLLFIGYGVLDWDFRLLVHTLLKSLTAQNYQFGVIAVQLPPETLREPQRAQVETYLKNFLETTNFKIRIYWGDTRAFMRELRRRWEGRS